MVTLGDAPGFMLPPPQESDALPPDPPARPFQSCVCPTPTVRPSASPRAATVSKRYCPSVVGQATEASVVFPCVLAAE
jgi:hypothetical protein